MLPAASTNRSPALVALDGPLRGHLFEIGDGPLGLGRGNNNRITVDDPSLSRQHCEFSWRGDELLVKDLDSHNGTFVNGAPVGEHVLRAGDEIRAGRTVLRYLGRDASWDKDLPSVRLEGSAIESPTLILLPSRDSVYLAPAQAAAAAAPTSSAIKGYRTLLRVAAAVHATTEVEPLADALLETMLECVPAERAALLLFRPDESEPFLVRARDRVDGAAARIDANRSAVDRAMREGTSILSGGVLLAAPLLSRQRAVGVLYLDADRAAPLLGPEHLQLAAAVGVICGPPMEHAVEFERLQEQNRELRREIQVRHEMVGESRPMQEVYRLVERVAPTDSTVLILGETGTGKELVARALHGNSKRAKGPFVAINCAVLSESLLESELFGHERGAFTGAVAQKKGKLEIADGGTLFLDEIGELPVAVQTKLLRVLQEREFERVGGTRTIRVDLRVVAATNRDLRTAARVGDFREDLYYRLSVVHIKVPPLRERREDIPLLASHFVNRGGGRRVSGISSRARACLMAYEWPGNVRELQHAIESAVVLGEGEQVQPEDLPEHIVEGTAGLRGAFHGSVQTQKASLIVDAVERAGGNIAQAARLLDLHPNYLHRLIRNLGLRGRIQRRGGAEGS